jgi:hypothetical protein
LCEEVREETQRTVNVTQPHDHDRVHMVIAMVMMLMMVIGGGKDCGLRSMYVCTYVGPGPWALGMYVGRYVCMYVCMHVCMYVCM